MVNFLPVGRVLVVDDEQSMREFLAICLKREGYEVSVAESGDEAKIVLEDHAFDVVISDMRMPGNTDGMSLLKHVKTSGLKSEVVMVTAFATPETAIEAMKIGAYDYLTKPFKVDEINAVIGRAMEKQTLVKANHALQEKVEGKHRLASLVGKSPQMQKVFELVHKIKATKTNVLVTGESGTGKELIARALHTEGPRKDKSFVAVNCGAIPAELMESELFGHTKGAFTGAVHDSVGLFQKADEGTLFLDEIGELSMNLQVKLLRALQEKKVRPVGASEEIEIDVRVVAATNRELEEEVERGSFRSDLYYRLNVIEIRIPPLRQREDDTRILLGHFLKQFSAEQRKSSKEFSRSAMQVLVEYDYPGNVRELENVVEHAVTMASGNTIEIEDLPRLHQRKNIGKEKASTSEFPEDGLDLDRTIADFERVLVRQALDKSNGVKKKAAQLLGITFRSLRYRLNKLGLSSEDDD